MQQTSDGGYILSAIIGAPIQGLDFKGSADIYVVKLKSDGTLDWQKTYGGSAFDLVSQILEVGGDTYLVSARTNSNDGDVVGLPNYYRTYSSWIFLLKNKEIQWQKHIDKKQINCYYLQIKPIFI